MNRCLQRILSVMLLSCFILTSFPVGVGAQEFLSSAAPANVQPTLLGLKVHPENPLLFDFIVDRGTAKFSEEQFKTETQKLVKYFLAALTIPDKDSWVNLSPTEANRIIPDILGKTEMGKTMLEQDYVLKQLASSLTNPGTELGKKYWEETAVMGNGRADQEAKELSRVWIMPGKAKVIENNGIVLIDEKKLKVLMADEQEGTHNIFRDMILPQINVAVNDSKDFAPVRQVYNSVILAAWYKQALKESLLGKVYADRGKVAGVETNDKEMKERVYQQYLAAFKKGAYNFIKEEEDPATGEVIPRKYFSGGIEIAKFDASATLTVARGSSEEMENKLRTVSSAAVVTVRGDEQRAATPVVATKTILLVDDDPAIIDALTLHLGDLEGYQILSASNVNHAKKILANPESKIDLVISDGHMPMIDGKPITRNAGGQLAYFIQDRYPNMPIFIYSSTPHDAIAGIDGLSTPPMFVKGNSLDELVAAIHQQIGPETASSAQMGNKQNTASSAAQSSSLRDTSFLEVAERLGVLQTLPEERTDEEGGFNLVALNLFALLLKASYHREPRQPLTEISSEELRSLILNSDLFYLEELDLKWFDLLENQIPLRLGLTKQDYGEKIARFTAKGNYIVYHLSEDLQNLIAKGLQDVKELEKEKQTLKLQDEQFIKALVSKVFLPIVAKYLQGKDHGGGEQFLVTAAYFLYELSDHLVAESWGQKEKFLHDVKQSYPVLEQTMTAMRWDLVTDQHIISDQDFDRILAALGISQNGTDENVEYLFPAGMILEILAANQEFEKGAREYYEQTYPLRTSSPLMENHAPGISEEYTFLKVTGASSRKQEFNPTPEDLQEGQLQLSQLLTRLGVDIKANEEGIKAFFDLLLKLRKKKQELNGQNYSTPDAYLNCDYYSDQAQAIVKQSEFISRKRGRSEIKGQKVSIHTFLEVDAFGQTFVLDMTADQFDKPLIRNLSLGTNFILRYPDAGVVLIPRSMIDQSNEKYWMYTQGKEVGFVEVRSSSSLVQQEANKKLPVDGPARQELGGIDFDQSKLNLQIKRDGKGVPLPLPQQNIDQINIEGLFPVIINVQPINAQTLPLFLGQAPRDPIKENEQLKISLTS